MKIFLGKSGLKKTWQNEFPETTDCTDCEGTARIAFVAIEKEGEALVCDLYNNLPGLDGYWPHDAIAVAVYFCAKCFKSVSLFNQA